MWDKRKKNLQLHNVSLCGLDVLDCCTNRCSKETACTHLNKQYVRLTPKVVMQSKFKILDSIVTPHPSFELSVQPPATPH